MAADEQRSPFDCHPITPPHRTITNYSTSSTLTHLKRCSQATLKTLCRERGITFGLGPKRTLAWRLDKDTVQAIVYEGRSTTALLNGIVARRLDYSDTSSNRDLVAVLEAADLARTFERFLELLAELRNMVYGHAFNDFFAAFNIFHPARIPAVCQTSRAVRQEALYELVPQEDGYTATLKRMGVVVPVTKKG
ncbi:hypothetical protein LTR17_000150 [Elasticomyces elasticus]|nr:hypothetical protein LTR17_000150 [Elasticomyces elasticus]